MFTVLFLQRETADFKIDLQLIEVQLYNNADTNWLRFNDLSEAINSIQQCQMTCYRKYDFKQKFVIYKI